MSQVEESGLETVNLEKAAEKPLIFANHHSYNKMWKITIGTPVHCMGEALGQRNFFTMSVT